MQELCLHVGIECGGGEGGAAAIMADTGSQSMVCAGDIMRGLYLLMYMICDIFYLL